jgi:2-polyprenyl-3-methyl-5-hydroxy-6-metoxy-1,4-benzoquinol methylase
MNSRGVETHFDEIAAEYDSWKRKAGYYYENLKRLLTEVVPKGARVCEVGCGTGDILASLEPGEGLGLDISRGMVELARGKHPRLRFDVVDITKGSRPEKFDYVVAVDVAEHVGDLDASFMNMARMLEPGGSLVITTANPRWAPVLHLAERLHLKMPEGGHEWRSANELIAAAHGAGLEVVSFDRSFLVPKRIIGIHRLNSARRARGLRNSWGLIQRLVLRDERNGN